MKNRLFSILAIFIVITGTLFQGYSIKYPVFGASWESCDTLEEQTQAFIAYCKSRDLTIEGSALDQVTSFTSKVYQSAMNAVGLNMNAIQAEVKQTTDGNNGLKYLFTATGADAFNRIFSQLLQDYDLEVGDTVDDEIVDTKQYFILDDGTRVEVWRINGYSYTTAKDQSLIIDRGSYLVKASDEFDSMAENTVRNYTFTVDGNVYKGTVEGIDGNTKNALTLRKYVGTAVINGVTNTSAVFMTYYGSYWINYLPGTNVTGGIIVFVDTNTSNLYFGNICINIDGRGNGTKFKLNSTRITNKTNSDTTTSNVYFTTNNNTINNNTYNNNTYTIINNEGDVYNYGDNDEPSPDTPVVPDDPSTPSNPDLPSGDGWDDFTLPEMPNDWLIYGMEKKFPFDIPFNIMFALSLLNHEPVTPRFQGDIDLKVCTWHYDINLEPFNDVAVILRKFEVLAFIIGLAILTKNLINWG